METNNESKNGSQTAIPLNYYALIFSNVQGMELTAEIIKHHVAHLKELDNAGKLVICGPFLDHPSSLIIINTKDKSEAIAIAQKDPLIIYGVRTFEVRTWLVANKENNYLLEE